MDGAGVETTAAERTGKGVAPLLCVCVTLEWATVGADATSTDAAGGVTPIALPMVKMPDDAANTLLDAPCSAIFAL